MSLRAQVLKILTGKSASIVLGLALLMVAASSALGMPESSRHEGTNDSGRVLNGNIPTCYLVFTTPAIAAKHCHVGDQPVEVHDVWNGTLVGYSCPCPNEVVTTIEPARGY